MVKKVIDYLRMNSSHRATVEEKLSWFDTGRTAREMSGILKTAIRDRSPRVRARAILFAMDNDIREIRSEVIRCLKDRSEEVRLRAAEYIGDSDRASGERRPELESVLTDPSPLVRSEAIESLVLIGNKGALPHIANLLRDKDAIVRSYAAGGIADLGGDEYKSLLEDTLRKEESELAKVGVLSVIAELGDRTKLSNLLHLLDSRDYHVRCAVANTLEGMDLSLEERTQALAALKRARGKPIAVADQSTVDRVMHKLQDR
jgi:HEAT repeats